MKKWVFTAELAAEEEGGFTVYCPELDIASQGETEEEALANIREAAELHVETLGELLSPRKITRREIEVFVNV